MEANGALVLQLLKNRADFITSNLNSLVYKIWLVINYLPRPTCSLTKYSVTNKLLSLHGKYDVIIAPWMRYIA